MWWHIYGNCEDSLVILQTLFHYVLFNQKQIGIQILLDLALPYDLPCFQTFLLLNILLSLEVGHSNKYTRLGDKHCQRLETWGLSIRTEVTSLGHIKSSYTNLDQISSSKSWPSIKHTYMLWGPTLDGGWHSLLGCLRNEEWDTFLQDYTVVYYSLGNSFEGCLSSLSFVLELITSLHTTKWTQI